MCRPVCLPFLLPALHYAESRPCWQASWQHPGCCDVRQHAVESDHSAKTKIKSSSDSGRSNNNLFIFLPRIQLTPLCVSHLPSSIRIGPSLQQKLCYIHLAVLGGYMERSEPFLQWHQWRRRHDIRLGNTVIGAVLRQPNSLQGRLSRQVSPSSSWSAGPPCPGGCVRFVRDLPEQRCVGACGLLSWWSWGLLCAPAAASRAPCGPSEQHNEEVFGHPGQQEVGHYEIWSTLMDPEHLKCFV